MDDRGLFIGDMLTMKDGTRVMCLEELLPDKFTGETPDGKESTFNRSDIEARGWEPPAVRDLRLTGAQKSFIIDAAMGEPGYGKKLWDSNPSGELYVFCDAYLAAVYLLEAEGRLEEAAKGALALPTIRSTG